MEFVEGKPVYALSNSQLESLSQNPEPCPLEGSSEALPKGLEPTTPGHVLKALGSAMVLIHLYMHAHPIEYKTHSLATLMCSFHVSVHVCYPCKGA